MTRGGHGQVLVIVRLSVLMVKLPYRPKRAFLSSAIFLPPTGELNLQLTARAPNNAVRARPFT